MRTLSRGLSRGLGIGHERTLPRTPSRIRRTGGEVSDQVIYSCPECGTGMEVDVTAKPMAKIPAVSTKSKSLPDGLQNIRRDLWCFAVVDQYQITKARLDAYVELGLMERVQRSPALYQRSDAGEAIIEHWRNEPITLDQNDIWTCPLPEHWLAAIVELYGSEAEDLTMLEQRARELAQEGSDGRAMPNLQARRL